MIVSLVLFHDLPVRIVPVGIAVLPHQVFVLLIRRAVSHSYRFEVVEAEGRSHQILFLGRYQASMRLKHKHLSRHRQLPQNGLFPGPWSPHHLFTGRPSHHAKERAVLHLPRRLCCRLPLYGHRDRIYECHRPPGRSHLLVRNWVNRPGRRVHMERGHELLANPSDLWPERMLIPQGPSVGKSKHT